MNSMNIIKAVAALDSGKWTFVVGELDEIRAVCDQIGNFYVSSVGDGQCKVTKVKSSQDTFYGSIAAQLSAYCGTPIAIRGEVQKIRMSVSRYNKLNGKTFSVRALGEDQAEAYSTNVLDFSQITLEMFEDEVEKRRKELQKLRTLVVDAEQWQIEATEANLTNIDEVTEEEFEDEPHDPSIFVTKPVEAQTTPPPVIENWKLAECPECGEEFTTLNADQLWCNDCIERADEDIL